MSITQGGSVEWNWGDGTATGTGTVQKTYTRKITVKIKGTEVARDGSDGDKALLIEQEDGDGVLKLESEVSRA